MTGYNHRVNVCPMINGYIICASHPHPMGEDTPEHTHTFPTPAAWCEHILAATVTRWGHLIKKARSLVSAVAPTNALFLCLSLPLSLAVSFPPPVFAFVRCVPQQLSQQWRLESMRRRCCNMRVTHPVAHCVRPSVPGGRMSVSQPSGPPALLFLLLARV